MDKDLAPRCVVPHDDILVIGLNKKEQEKRLVKVLQHFKDSRITLGPDKCLFSMSRLQYLDQVIDNGRIGKDPAKVKPAQSCLNRKTSLT